MNGIQIQYLLGLYFALHTIRFESGRIVADFAQVVIGVILVILAALAMSLIR